MTSEGTDSPDGMQSSEGYQEPCNNSASPSNTKHINTKHINGIQTGNHLFLSLCAVHCCQLFCKRISLWQDKTSNKLTFPNSWQIFWPLGMILGTHSINWNLCIHGSFLLLFCFVNLFNIGHNTNVVYIYLDIQLFI